MRRHYIGAILGCALLFSLPAVVQAANFSGTWAASGTLGRQGSGVFVSTAPVCVFRQRGNAVSGTCKGPNAIGSALGAVRGFSIEWQWHDIATNPRGISGIATFRGTLGSDGVIRGDWTFSPAPGYVGEFSAQRVP